MFKKTEFLLLVILAVSAALRLFRLDFAKGRPVFDERRYYVNAAKSYLEGRDDTVPEHPPLGKELIALGILLFGDNPWGWRMPSLVFSLTGIFLTYQLAKEVFEKKDVPSTINPFGSETLRVEDHQLSTIPLLAALLLSVDSMYFIYSRLAVLDMFLTVFILMTLLFLWRTSQREAGSGKREVLNLVLLAVSFGLALATKWTALHLVPVITLFLWLRYQRIPRFLGMIAMTIMIALAVYVISYFPFIIRHSFENAIALHREVVSAWWHSGEVWAFTPETYFLNHAPVWLFNPMTGYHADTDGRGRLIAVIGHFNPIIFWGAIGWGVWKALAVRKCRSFWVIWEKIIGDRRMLFLVVPILSNILPWFFVRRVQYLYYVLPSLPLIVILFASGLHRAVVVHRDRVILFLLVAATAFIYDFPLLTGTPISPRMLNPLAKSPLHIQVFEPYSSRDVFIHF